MITIEVWKKILPGLISLSYLSNTEMVGSDFLCKQHDTMDLSCFVSVVQVLLAVYTYMCISIYLCKWEYCF